jgi:hypothetical protein
VASIELQVTIGVDVGVDINDGGGSDGDCDVGDDCGVDVDCGVEVNCDAGIGFDVGDSGAAIITGCFATVENSRLLDHKKTEIIVKSTSKALTMIKSFLLDRPVDTMKEGELTKGSCLVDNAFSPSASAFSWVSSIPGE